MLRLLKSPIGIFVVKNSKIIEKVLFPKDPELIAHRLSSEQWPEIEDIKKRMGKFSVEWLGDYRKFALECSWADEKELNAILTKVGILLSRSRIRKTGKDRVIMRVASVIEELNHDINSLTERLREWYGLYFPEAVKKIRSLEKMLQIAKAGKKENIKDKDLLEIAKKSAGMDFSEKDIEKFVELANKISDLIKLRESLQKYLDEISKQIIPNTSAVAGSLLAAKLLTLAGGLEKLAKLPASTIQLLGAEKALFRHLRKKTKAPKYGIIFTHPLIQQASKKKRGKVARLLAAKISLAARIDHFSGEDRSKSLLDDLKRQMSKL